MERFRNPYALSLEFELDKPDEIKKARGNKKRGAFNISHRINNSIYSPAGGGLTTAGTPVLVRMQTNALYHLAWEAQKWAVDERHQLDTLLTADANYDPTTAIFRFHFEREGTWIYYETSSVAVLYSARTNFGS